MNETRKYHITSRQRNSSNTEVDNKYILKKNQIKARFRVKERILNQDEKFSPTKGIKIQKGKSKALPPLHAKIESKTKKQSMKQ